MHDKNMCVEGKMSQQTDAIRNAPINYAKGRNHDVQRGIETPDLSALLVEKYAVGLVDAVRALGLTEIDINLITTEADRLCIGICPEHQKLRALRYQRVAALDLTKHRS